MLMPLIFVIALIGVTFQAIFISREYKQKYISADVFKGLASLVFVCIGFFGNRVCQTDFSLFILIGLIFGLIGDVVMNLRFVLGDSGQKAFLAGILAFLIGHVMYLTALVPLAVHLGASIIIGAIIAVALLAYIFSTMDVKIAFKIFGVFYLGAVIIMTVMAVDIAIFATCNQSICYAIGAILFTASDIVLIFNTFSGVTRFPLRVTNLSLYYIGQLLIAFCLFF